MPRTNFHNPKFCPWCNTALTYKQKGRGNKFCSRKCGQDFEISKKEDEPQRFWKKVKIGGPDECWPYTGYTNPDGYGMLRLEGCMQRTHRYAYKITNGEIPEGLEILHTCDFPACNNPLHLKAGTHDENMKDMAVKNRANPVVGEKHHRATLKESDVIKIKEDYSKKIEPTWEIAVRYNVSTNTIDNIINGKTWKYLFGGNRGVKHG